MDSKVSVIMRFQCIFDRFFFQILGEVDLFEKAVRNVMRDVSFDNDVVVSVFETNIRVMGSVPISNVSLAVLYLRPISVTPILLCPSSCITFQLFKLLIDSVSTLQKFGE